MTNPLRKRIKTEYNPKTWNGKPATLSPEYSQKSLHAWRKLSAEAGLAPIEFLLPTYQVVFDNRLPDSMQTAELAYQRDPEAVPILLKHRWGYYYYLGGGFSTKSREPGQEDGRAQSILRIQAINDVIARIFGDDLDQCTLLDMACNWGGMALDMAYRGCNVLGVDIRPENVDKARALTAYLGLEHKAKFEQGDVTALSAGQASGRYDIVYNLGLMYHLTKPLEAMQITYDLCDKVAVIDCDCLSEIFSGFALLSTGLIKQPDHARGFEAIEFKPTYRALIDMMLAVGFKDLFEVTVDLGPSFPAGPSRKVLESYNRRRLIGFK